ncbi:MAG: hypothetical protein Q7S32_01675 [bacterium]|nr:hypothetical protein [bacterium]
MKYGELNLGQIEAIVNKLGGMDGVQRLLSGELVFKAVELLRQIATVSSSAITKFVAKDVFTTKNKSVKIYFVGDNFKKVMLDKVESGIEATTLIVSKLEKASLDVPILSELGDRAETTLGQLYGLLMAQPNGEAGSLLTNGYANIFYIRGIDGNLWAVVADWSSGSGWDVSAHSIGFPRRWSAGHQVVSR